MNFFHRYFRAKAALIHALPYPPHDPPKTVVHLRSPDGALDRDRGLDEESLKALGEKLKGNGTYLVTNRADWYQKFHDCCQWSYDSKWVGRPIRHSALNKVNFIAEAKQDNVTQNIKFDEEQALKMFSDWYTMLNAIEVYHSNSDFSRSAVHWNANSTGFQLHGMHMVQTQNGTQVRQLNLVHAPYDSVPYRIPPLVERKRQSKIVKDDTCQFLRNCRSRPNVKRN